MRRSNVVCLLALIAGQGLEAQADTSARVLGYSLPGMERVEVIAGQRYATVRAGDSTRALTLDAYRPPGARAGERRPAVLFVHGGLIAGATGPLPTEWPSYRAWGRLVAAAGFVGITFNHRLDTDGNLEEAGADVDSAVAHVRAHADRLGVDRDRLCVAVYSAGGPLASAFLAGRHPSVRCVVLFYPYLTLDHMRTASPFRGGIAAARVDSLEPRFSPARVAATRDGAMPPIFLAIAGRDAIPGLSESVRWFLDVALVHRATIDVALHRDGVHGFDQRNHDARTREILEDVLRFFRIHLTP